MKKRMFALLLALSLCLGLAVATGVCAVESEEDYDALLENIAETIREPWPSNESKICGELLEMLLFDVKDFIESLAFCDAKNQQAVIDLFLKYASDEELEALLLVVEK